MYTYTFLILSVHDYDGPPPHDGYHSPYHTGAASDGKFSHVRNFERYLNHSTVYFFIYKEIIKNLLKVDDSRNARIEYNVIVNFLFLFLFYSHYRSQLSGCMRPPSFSVTIKGSHLHVN